MFFLNVFFWLLLIFESIRFFCDFNDGLVLILLFANFAEFLNKSTILFNASFLFLLSMNESGRAFPSFVGAA